MYVVPREFDSLFERDDSHKHQQVALTLTLTVALFMTVISTAATTTSVICCP